MQEPATVQERTHGRVRVVTLDRPERHNAIDLRLRAELGDAIERALDDPGIRALVITGAGGTFCSGGDLSTMSDVAPPAARARTEAAQRITRLLRGGSKPTVAAVEGAAFGAGVALALACDRVVAAEDARFSTAFTRVGLAGDMGITFTLPARVGPARARQLLMMPRELTAAEAAGAGLVDELVAPGVALQQALSDAEQLADGPPLALAAIRRALDEPAPALLTALEREARVQVELFASNDLAEGAAAFTERRAPRFEGK